jgi:hypothetical protein
MIVASIHDPEVFAPARFAENDQYEGRIVERLRVMQHSHLLVVDDSGGNSVIAVALAANIAQNAATQMAANAVIRNERCVRLPVDLNRHRKIAQWIDAPGSAEAVALAGHGDVDICVVAQDTLDAIEEENIRQDRVTTLAQYHTTRAFSKESLVFGGRPVSDLTKAQFLDEIVRPVVHWATSLTIVDKMISRSAFGDAANPAGAPSGNWPRFNDTLRAIFDQWDAGPFCGQNRVTIITEAVTHVVRNNTSLLGDNLAAELAHRLSIPTNRARIVLKNPQQVKDINYDRYLVTNHAFIVGITRGFDLLDGGANCAVSDVFLRQAQAQGDALARLMNSQRGTTGVHPVH